MRGLFPNGRACGAALLLRARAGRVVPPAGIFLAR